MHLVAIGGSDAGISAAPRASRARSDHRGHRGRRRRLPELLYLRGFPGLRLSGRGLPTGATWRIARSTISRATGRASPLNTLAIKIDVGGRRLRIVVEDETGAEDQLAYDQLVVGTGAVPARPRIEGLVGPGAASARPTACTCSIPWATPSSWCARSRRTSRPVL